VACINSAIDLTTYKDEAPSAECVLNIAAEFYAFATFITHPVDTGAPVDVAMALDRLRKGTGEPPNHFPGIAGE